VRPQGRSYWDNTRAQCLNSIKSNLLKTWLFRPVFLTIRGLISDFLVTEDYVFDKTDLMELQSATALVVQVKQLIRSVSVCGLLY